MCVCEREREWSNLRISTFSLPKCENCAVGMHWISCFISPGFRRALAYQFSRSVVSNSLRPHEPQHTRPPCPSPTPGVHPNPCHRVSDAIQPFHPLSSPSPALNLFQHQGLFQWVSSSHQVAQSIGVSASTSVFPMILINYYTQGWKMFSKISNMAYYLLYSSVKKRLSYLCVFLFTYLFI